MKGAIVNQGGHHKSFFKHMFNVFSPLISLVTDLVFLSIEQVIENHSKQQEKQRMDDSSELEQRDEDTLEDAAEDEEQEEDEDEEDPRVEDSTNPDVSFASQSDPYTDGRLVKSQSEAPVGSPKG